MCREGSRTDWMEQRWGTGGVMLLEETAWNRTVPRDVVVEVLGVHRHGPDLRGDQLGKPVARGPCAGIRACGLRVVSQGTRVQQGRRRSLQSFGAASRQYLRWRRGRRRKRA